MKTANHTRRAIDSYIPNCVEKKDEKQHAAYVAFQMTGPGKSAYPKKLTLSQNSDVSKVAFHVEGWLKGWLQGLRPCDGLTDG